MESRIMTEAARKILARSVAASSGLQMQAEPATSISRANLDDCAVDDLAAWMKAGLEKKRADGYSLWEDKLLCSHQKMSDLFHAQVEKGNVIGAANYLAFLQARGENILPKSRPEIKGMPTFEQAWNAQVEKGFQYGYEALSNVHLGWRMAMDCLAAEGQDGVRFRAMFHAVKSGDQAFCRAMDAGCKPDQSLGEFRAAIDGAIVASQEAAK